MDEKDAEEYRIRMLQKKIAEAEARKGPETFPRFRPEETPDLRHWTWIRPQLVRDTLTVNPDGTTEFKAEEVDKNGV